MPSTALRLAVAGRPSVSSGRVARFSTAISMRRNTTSSTYLIAGGVLAGAAAAVLLNPWNGRDLRSRVGKLFGGSVGKLVGEQFGAHPIGTANAVQKTRELLGAQ